MAVFGVKIGQPMEEVLQSSSGLVDSHHYTCQWKVNPGGLDLLSSRLKHFSIGSELPGELLSLCQTVLAAYGRALVIDDNHASVCESK